MIGPGKSDFWENPRSKLIVIKSHVETLGKKTRSLVKIDLQVYIVLNTTIFKRFYCEGNI